MSRTRATIKVPKVKPRNPHALDAKQRHAGAMKDRRAPRGGAANKQAEILQQYKDECADEDFAIDCWNEYGEYEDMMRHA